MPELPEVETVARGVDKRVRGDRIVAAWFSAHREPFKTPSAQQADGLIGRTFLAIHRTGKHIVCELGAAKRAEHKRRKRRIDEARIDEPRIDEARIDEARIDEARIDEAKAEAAPVEQPDAQWIVHLGMTGRLLVTTPEAPVAAHTHARLSLASGREVRFVDPRRFGRLEFRDLSAGKGFAGPGLEPLTIGSKEFADLFHGRNLAIKAALLNQTLLAGVGNIYADESLFRAGLRPRRRTGRLTRAELERLRLALRAVLEHAIRRGGSSVSDYVDAEGMRGFFQLEHCVYQRTGEPCLRCKTPIRRIVLAGRSTHYCATCQH